MKIPPFVDEFIIEADRVNFQYNEQISQPGVIPGFYLLRVYFKDQGCDVNYKSGLSVIEVT